MSELKSFIVRYNGKFIRAYEETEVDRYISELIADQQSELDDWYCKVQHQKYKRCLAMARWCKMSARENDTRMCLPTKCNFTKHEEYLYFICYYHKWHKRWLELAEKFKEAK